jgi:thiol-disulfide isomerase/thioredoxin
MTLGAWVLTTAVVVAVFVGAWWTLTNGVFRGTRRVRGASSAGGFETGGERPPQPSEAVDRPPQPPEAAAEPSVLVGTAYDGRRGERATLLQFSSAFCAPCRATRRVLADVASAVPGVAHVEVDAEHHLDLVRALGVLRTPTTLVLDADGREVSRAAGTPRAPQVLSALEDGVP